MTYQIQDNGVKAAVELMADHGLSGLPDAITMLINEAMRVERQRHLGVGAYERSPQRTGYANGYKVKTSNRQVRDGRRGGGGGVGGQIAVKSRLRRR